MMVGLGCSYGAMLDRHRTVGGRLFVSWGEEGEWLPGHEHPAELRRVCLHDPNSCQTPTMNASNSTISNTHQQVQQSYLQIHPNILIVDLVHAVLIVVVWLLLLQSFFFLCVVFVLLFCVAEA